MNIEQINNDYIPQVKEWEKIVVRNEAEYGDAATKYATCKDMIDKIDEYWKPQIDAAYKTHKELCKRRDEMRKPVQKVMDAIKSAVNRYTASRKNIESQAVAENVKTVIVEKKEVEVVDIIALAKSVINGEIKKDALLPNMKYLTELAEIVPAIAGCVIKTRKETIVRRLK